MTALAYVNGPSTVPLIGQTIGENLAATVAAHGDRDALIDVPTGRRWTYRELAADVDAVAKGLLSLGIEKGDRVGIWAPNVPEWVLTQFATARIGAILVNINPAYRSHELAYVLQQSGIRTLVSAESFKTSDYRGMIDEVRRDCPDLVDVVYIGTPSWVAMVAGGGSTSPENLTERESTLDFDDPINIQYTSGTTGFPKGATLSHHNILNNGYFVARTQNWSEQDRVCIPVPFYHCFGMVMGNLGAVTHGACIVIPGPGFEPAATLDAVVAERCTVLYGVPTMFIAELADPTFRDHDLSTLRTGVMAGSPCPVEVMKRVIAEMGMAEVTICYGMTETSPVSTQTRPDDDLERRVSTVGAVHPHLEVKVVDPASGHTVRRGEPGEFCTRGYSVMLGYWNMPDRTAEAIDAARWMHTGDLAVMDNDGYLSIVGRIKDMVIRGGENVYPREIEEFLYTHPDIVDAQVVGVPDERYGEELMVWVRHARRGAAAGCRRRPRVLHRPARALQDPAVRQDRRGVPDDRDRQDSQGRDARGVDRRARSPLTSSARRRAALARRACRLGAGRLLGARRAVGCARAGPSVAPAPGRRLRPRRPVGCARAGLSPRSCTGFGRRAGLRAPKFRTVPAARRGAARLGPARLGPAQRGPCPRGSTPPSPSPQCGAARPRWPHLYGSWRPWRPSSAEVPYSSLRPVPARARARSAQAAGRRPRSECGRGTDEAGSTAAEGEPTSIRHLSGH